MSKSVEEISEELGAHIFRWGASSNNLPTVKFREEKEKAIKQILEALTAERKRAEDAEAENKRLREALELRRDYYHKEHYPQILIEHIKIRCRDCDLERLLALGGEV